MKYIQEVIWPAHHRVDHHQVLAPLTRKDLTSDRYCRILSVLSWFQEAVQPRLVSGAYEYSAGAIRPLDRLSWLREDLAFFRKETALADAPDIDRWLKLDLGSPAQWAGAMYALEGSTRGGLHIAKRLKVTKGYYKGRGATFFTGLGPGKTEQNWQRMWEGFGRLGIKETDPGMISGALSLFDSLHRLLENSRDHATES